VTRSAAPQRLVVDTDVVSFLFKGDTRAARYRPHLDGRLLVISFMTLAELDQWALAHRWGEARKLRLESHLATFTVFPYDRGLCRWWALASVRARRAGRPIQPSDAWIAATALLYGVPLITHNPGDYAGVSGLTLITEAPA
jgi:tRNA(fMet)-specific endonuclease VapC